MADEMTGGGVEATRASGSADRGPEHTAGQWRVYTSLFVTGLAIVLAAGQIATVPSQGWRKLPVAMAFWTVAVVLAVLSSRAVAARCPLSHGRAMKLRVASIILGIACLAGATWLGLSGIRVSDPLLVPSGTSCGKAFDVVGTDSLAPGTPANEMIAASAIEADCEQDIQQRQGLTLFTMQLGLTLVALSVVIRSQPQSNQRVANPPMI